MEPRPLTHHIAGEGEPLVLVPGGLTGWLSWIPHQERLSDHHRVVRVQPIGNEMGSAGIAQPPDYSSEIEVESLLLTADTLGFDKADFAGWSLGGRTLIDFAVDHPERIRTLTLVEPAARWILDGLGDADPRLDEANALLDSLAGKEVTEEDLAAFLGFAGFVTDPADAFEHPAWQTWVEHRAALSWISPRRPGRRRTLDDVWSIPCPALLVKGTTSEPMDQRLVDLLGRHLPDARVVELEGDHAAHIQSIDRFIEELEAHLH